MCIRLAIGSTTAFLSGWCNANPSDPCRRGITRLCPCVTGSGFAKQQPAPQQLQRPLARVSTRTLIESLIGVRWRLLCPKPQASA
jgi:hypothetical protein